MGYTFYFGVGVPGVTPFEYMEHQVIGYMLLIDIM